MDERTRYDEMRDQCVQFHRQHPMVWQLFVKFSLERIHRGFANYSINAIFERIRWETDQAKVDGKPQFKINNNYRPFYARAFMKKYPEHDGFFRTRKQTSKDDNATGMPELGPEDFE